MLTLIGKLTPTIVARRAFCLNRAKLIFSVFCNSSYQINILFRFWKQRTFSIFISTYKISHKKPTIHTKFGCFRLKKKPV